MRLFVAVVPPPETRDKALHTARSLPWEGRIRWLPPQNVHLTLKFLGETPEQDVRALEDALSTVCERHEALHLTLDKVGAFPSTRRARVLWMGVGRGHDPLCALAADVENELENIGVEREERAFHPHVTVGRSRDGKARLEEPQRETAVNPLPFRVESVELVQSQLAQEGALYSTVASFPLRAHPAAAT